MARETVVELRDVSTQFGAQVVHQGLNLSVERGEVLGLAGGSGSGKSVLLREMILLQAPTRGQVRLFGEDVATLTPERSQALRRRCGVMFQKGGLFGALNVRENVGLPLREARREGGHERDGQGLSDALIDGIAEWKLGLTGLPADVGLKHPEALSGGMLKRAAMARALALDPELLFLDEPTSGLDPASAAGLCELIQKTRELFQPTVVIVSHDVDLLWRLTDRVAVLGEGRVLAIDRMAELAHHPHPIVQSYFTDRRSWKTN